LRQLRGCAGRDDLAVEEDRNAVAHELDLGEQVRVQEDRDAAPAQLLEQQPDGAATDRVEGRRWLVQEQHARLADECLRDAEPLLHALRHSVDPPVSGVRERNELEQARTLGGAAARA
jgi:hypothetical protein